VSTEQLECRSDEPSLRQERDEPVPEQILIAIALNAARMIAWLAGTPTRSCIHRVVPPAARVQRQTGDNEHLVTSLQ
jgi:hypothetical protein